MFFETYMLCSYNRQFSDDLITDCAACYADYKDPQRFYEFITKKRGTYAACLNYSSIRRKRIAHKTVPILIGSYLDFCIRGHHAILEDRAMWGAIIKKGLLYFYRNFSTFDNSLHVRETKTSKCIQWFVYVGDDGLEIKYENNLVSYTYQRITAFDNAWCELLERANPFGTQVLSSEYLEMFERILAYPYSMNDLKNRQILNASEAIRKYITYDLKRRKKSKALGGMKMSKAFENGTLYAAMSKKNIFDTDEWCKSYPQTYDTPLHEGRSNKTAHFLPSIMRASNAAVRNSNALAFPNDAINYFCMLNTKDLKTAGEQNVLSDYTIMSEATDALSLYKHIVNNFAESDGEHIITIDGFLINCRCTWTLDKLIKLKSVYPHVTSFYHLPYVQLSSRASILIKYHEPTNTMYSPAETQHFNITFYFTDTYSITAKEIGLDALLRTMPAKSTVSINNIKGSVSKRTSRLHQGLMENSLGVSCYMDISQAEIDKLIDFSVLDPPGTHSTRNFEVLMRMLDDEYKLTENKALAMAIPVTDRRKAMEKLATLYPMSEKLNHHRNHLQFYMNMLFSGSNFNPPSVWNLRLRCVFGNPFGDCILDGLVLDSNIQKHIPPVYYNACITVEFTFKKVKQPLSSVFAVVDESENRIDDNTLIGCLISEHEVYVKHSKHTHITESLIGKHYYYLIKFLPKQSKTYDNLQVRRIYNDNTLMIVITGQKKTRVNVGSKMANAFGQKNVISAVHDLSSVTGVTRDGRRVHAQLVYYENSLIGRLASGQLHAMFQSNELAFCDNDTTMFIAPVDLVIHTIHPYTNLKVFRVKNDTLTNINGFDSQNLSNASDFLRTSSVDRIINQIMGYHGYDIKFQKMIDVYRVVHEDDDDYHNDAACEDIQVGEMDASDVVYGVEKVNIETALHDNNSAQLLLLPANELDKQLDDDDDEYANDNDNDDEEEEDGDEEEEEDDDDDNGEGGGGDDEPHEDEDDEEEEEDAMSVDDED